MPQFNSSVPMFAPLVVMGIILLVVLAIFAQWWFDERRRKELAGWATSLGLAFSADRDRAMEHRLSDFDCLKRGDSRYAYNIMEGQWSGRSILGFDYHYETHSTDSKGRRQTTHHRFSVVVAGCPCPVKGMLIRPENWFDKLKAFVGWEDIDFESAEFSDRFHVTATDRKWAYDVLHARAMQLLLDRPQFSIQFSGERAMAWRDATFGVADFDAATRLLSDLLGLLPEYVLRDCAQQRSGNAWSPRL